MEKPWVLVHCTSWKTRPSKRLALRLEPLEARRLLAVGAAGDWAYTLQSPLGGGVMERSVSGGLVDDAPTYASSETPRATAGILNPDVGVGGFNLDLIEGPDLQTNAAAQAAFERAAQFWESLLSDPITVRLDADFTSVGFSGPNVVGSTSVQNFNFQYSDIRARLTYDAAPNESLVNSLPAVGALNFSLPAGPSLLQLTSGVNNPVMAVTRANALALGFTNLTTGVPSSAFSPGVLIDGTIKFNSAFSFDFDNSNGVSPGSLDFESVAIHEIGHALGFFSTVDVVDAVLDSGNAPTNVYPQVLDLFRLAPGQGANFSTANRVLTTGGNQVLYDGQFDVGQYAPAFAATIAGLAPGDIVMSTGRATGDGQQASHYKAGEISGYTGLMDPTINFAEVLPFTKTDLRLFGLIGWDTVNSGRFAPAPTVAVTPKATNDTTPSLGGTLTADVPATASVYVGIPGALGTDSATLTADGFSTTAGAFVLANAANSHANIVRAEVILPGFGSFGNLIPDYHMHTRTGGGSGAATDFEAGAGQPALVGLLSPQSDSSTSDGDQFSISKTLVMTFNDFNPGESISWRIDIDPGGVTGEQLAGGVLVVTWDNGLSTRGSLAAIGAANPDASTVTVVQNHALKATNNGNGTWTLADNLLPVLAAGAYNVQATVWDESEARTQDATLNELVIDVVAPAVDIVDVAPDPRNSTVNAISIVFSEAVAGFNLADLVLSRNGGPNLLTGGESLTSADNITWTLSGLGPLTGAEGNYTLTLAAAGSGISDTAGNLLATGASDAWTVDTTSPTVDVVDVTPDPRNTAVDSLSITFSEAVSGFDLADLSLTRDGGANLLTGAQTLTSADNVHWNLGGLSSLTAAAGQYVLTVSSSGTGIVDTVGNALAAGASDAWTVDLMAPTADIVDVAPDPRNSGTDSIAIVFSEPVTGLNLADLALTRNGGANLLTGAQTLTSADNITWTLGGLNGLAAAAGNYSLLLTAAGSGIVDAAGNALLADASDAWVVDTTAPTVNVVDVVPDPRNTAVASVSIVFSEAVSGFDLADLQLTRDGGANLLTGAESLNTLDNITWTLSGLGALTTSSGAYVLTLGGTGIVDAAGNSLSSGDSDSWVTDSVAPTVDVVDVSPDPRGTPVDSIDLVFSEAVSGLDLSDLSLTRDGGANLLPGGAFLATLDSITWTVSGLGALTTASGAYQLTLTAAGSGILDTAGNALASSASDAWTVVGGPSVDVTDVAPDPRNTAVSSIDIVFSEAVSGFDVADLALARDGGANLLTGSETLTSSDNITWTLSGLSGLTGTAGQYQLTLTAGGAGISGASGALTVGAADSWAMDLTAPTADIVDVTPDPRGTAIDALTITFNEPVAGLDLSDLQLTRDGGLNLLLGTESLTTNDQITWTISGLAALTATPGAYEVTLTAASSGIADLAGNLLAVDAADTWLVEPSPPTVDIVDVAPDPRSSAVSSVQIVFSEPVLGFDLADLSLTREGGANLLTGANSLTTADNITWTLEGLGPLTGVSGQYLLTLTAAGSGITDAGLSPLAGGDSDAWTTDTHAPIANVTPVAPDPRNSAVSAVEIVFDEPITGFDLADLQLTRDGGANLLTGGESLTSADNIVWTLGGLSGLTATAGQYELSLAASGSGIQDAAANPLAVSTSDTWLVDLTAPTADILDVVPDPRNAGVSSLTIVFSEAVAGLQLADLALTLDGGANLLTGSETLDTTDGVTWTLGGLSTLTSPAGQYQVTLTAAGSAVADLAGNPLAGNAQDAWQVDTSAPTANFDPVAPNPRKTSLASVTFVFSEAVTGVNLADLVLRRDGGANLLTGAETLNSPDGIHFTLSGLSTLTAPEGSYVLYLVSSGSGIVDAAGNGLAADAELGWMVDLTAPHFTIVPVSPDPRSTAVDEIEIVFSEAVSGFTLADLSLSLNGSANLLTGSQTLSSADGVSWTLSGLAGLTASAGSYSLALAGGSVDDLAGNALGAGGVESWLVDISGPTADIVDVSPDPRTSGVSQISIVFNEVVTGFDLSDLALSRNGGSNLLTGAQTLGTVDGIHWTLGNLGGVTGADGSYQLSLAAGAGVTDAAGNALVGGATDSWSQDSTSPLPSIVAVSPDPRNSPVGSIAIVFSEAVTGFNLGDLLLDRANDGQGNLLTAAQTLTTNDNITWTLGNLTPVTGQSGDYTLSLASAGSGIADAVGNPLLTNAVEHWTADITPPTVTVGPVSPDPRSSPVTSLQIVFSEFVNGFDLGDITLVRNGGPNLLTGGQTLTTNDNITWALGNLGAITAAEGGYLLNVSSSGGIVDLLGNGLAANSADTWVVDLSAPALAIVPVNPDPHPAAVNELTLVFNEPITGFNLSDLVLSRNGGPNLLTGAQTLSTNDNATWKLGNLAGLTNTPGQYTLSLIGSPGIADLAGNALGATPSEIWSRAAWLPGDANLDGTVDLTDFGILKANFGAGDEWSEGDFNGDGKVDLSDFGILKANFGSSGAVALSPAPLAASASTQNSAALEAAWAAWDAFDEAADGSGLGGLGGAL